MKQNHGSAKTSYYFNDNELFFAFQEEFSEASMRGPFTKKENRFYIADGKLIRALEKEQTIKSGDFKMDNVKNIDVTESWKGSSIVSDLTKDVRGSSAQLLYAAIGLNKGRWISKKDPNAGIEIKDGKFIMALLSGLLFFGALAFFQFDGGMTPTFDSSDTLLLIYPFIAISAIFLSQTLYGKLLATAQEKPGLKLKLQSYQTASIVKIALIEGPAFLGIVLSMATGNTAYLAIAGVLIIFLLMQKPSRAKVESDLNLRGDDRNQFNRYDEVID